MYKLRTIVADAESTGRQITVWEDPRITKSGALWTDFKVIYLLLRRLPSHKPYCALGLTSYLQESESGGNYGAIQTTYRFSG